MGERGRAGGEYGRIESQDDAIERRQETAGERDPRDANGGHGSELRSITQDGTNAGVRDWCERKREKVGKSEERANGGSSHTGRG